MTEGSGSVTLEMGDREGIRLLREAFDSAHYDTAHIRPMLRADSDSLTPGPGDIPIVVRLLPKGDRLASLFLSPDLQTELVEIKLIHVGIFRFDPDADDPSTADKIARFTAELYVEQTQFNVPPAPVVT